MRYNSQAQMAEELKKQAAQTVYGRQPNQNGLSGALAGQLGSCTQFGEPNMATTAPLAPLRQIAALNSEGLKGLERKLREVRDCAMNAQSAEGGNPCPPDACGLPSVESSLIETEYTVNRLHSLADELLARL